MSAHSKVTDALMQRNLVRSWLMPRLEAAGLTQKDLAHEVGVSGPTVNDWLSGQKPIPHQRLLTIAEVLRLKTDEIVELASINASAVLVEDVSRNIHDRASSNTDDSLFAHFAYPWRIFERLVDYAAKLAELDTTAQPGTTLFAKLWTHLSAAQRAVDDIDAWLAGAREHVLVPENIESHLRYPLNYYLGFFLKEVKLDDGDSVELFHAEIVSDLFECARDLRSQDRVPHMIALHAVHVLSRYCPEDRDANLRRLINDPNINTQRMALFGHVFSPDGLSFVGQLSERIMKDEEFSDAVAAFDAVHYRDYSKFRDIENPNVVPVNAFSRHVQGMLSADEVVRQIAAVRILRLLQKYDGPLRSSADVRTTLTSFADVIASRTFSTKEQREAHSLLLGMVEYTRSDTKS